MIHKVYESLHFCNFIILELPLLAERNKFTQAGILRPRQSLMHNRP